MPCINLCSDDKMSKCKIILKDNNAYNLNCIRTPSKTGNKFFLTITTLYKSNLTNDITHKSIACIRFCGHCHETWSSVYLDRDESRGKT